MKEILARLDEFDYIKTIIFAEEVILKVSTKDFDYISIYLQGSICFLFLCVTRNLSISGQCAIVSFRFTLKVSPLRKL